MSRRTTRPAGSGRPAKPPRSVRLADIAKEVGVSRAVVGHTLLGSGQSIRVSARTAARIHEVAARLNYRPNQIARQLRGVRSRLLGVLAPIGMNPANHARLMAVEAEAFQRGYRCIVGQIHDEPTSVQYVDDFEAYGVQVVLYLGSPTAKSVLERLGCVPLVIFSDPQAAQQHVRYVTTDRTCASRLAVEHLVQRGRRRIALVASRVDSPTARARHDGFIQAIGDAGMDPTQAPIWCADLSQPNPLDQAPQALEQLVTRHNVDAIVAGNDDWAASLLNAAHRRGVRVPDELAITGYNNSRLASLVWPELTSIDHRHDVAARHMLDMVQSWTEHGEVVDVSEQVFVEPELVVRQST